MFTATADIMLPSTVTAAAPCPRWFDVSLWGHPLDTCMLDVRFREKFQDAMAVVISDQERAGLDILNHGDFHVDEDMAGRAWHHYPLQRWAGFEGDYLQPEETRAPWLHYPPGTLLNEIYTAWRWPHVVGKIEHRPGEGAEAGPVRHVLLAGDGALPGHPHAQVQGQAPGDLGHGRGDEQGADRAARRRLQVHPGGRADAALHGEHVWKRRRAGEVHGRRVQSRSRGVGRR